MPQMIELTDRSGLDYLDSLLERAKNMRPVLKEIGEDMAESTKQRFVTATAPDGTPRELFEAMKMIAEKGVGPAIQNPSIGCSIKWREA